MGDAIGDDAGFETLSADHAPGGEDDAVDEDEFGFVGGAEGFDEVADEFFVFLGRTGKVMKILYWDKSGFCLWVKRLEEEAFPYEAETFSTAL